MDVDFCGLAWYNLSIGEYYMKILTGTYEYFLDEKGRTRIPQVAKEILGENLYVGKGMGSYLAVYSEEALTEKAQLAKEYSEIRSADKEVMNLVSYYRDFFSDVAPFTSDNQKRYRIPKNLIKYAGLDDDEKILFVGNNTVLEIWSPKMYEHRYDTGIAFSRILPKKEEKKEDEEK